MRRLTIQFVLAICTMLGTFSIAAVGLRAQDSPKVEARTPPVTDSTADADPDPVPTMFSHPESDRWWISGQANFISQWHPEFHSLIKDRGACPRKRKTQLRVSSRCSPVSG